jgi:hypothetical protein
MLLLMLLMLMLLLLMLLLMLPRPRLRLIQGQSLDHRRRRQSRLPKSVTTLTHSTAHHVRQQRRHSNGVKPANPLGA